MNVTSVPAWMLSCGTTRRKNPFFRTLRPASTDPSGSRAWPSRRRTRSASTQDRPTGDVLLAAGERVDGEHVPVRPQLHRDGRGDLRVQLGIGLDRLQLRALERARNTRDRPARIPVGQKDATPVPLVESGASGRAGVRACDSRWSRACSSEPQELATRVGSAVATDAAMALAAVTAETATTMALFIDMPSLDFPALTTPSVTSNRPRELRRAIRDERLPGARRRNVTPTPCHVNSVEASSAPQGRSASTQPAVSRNCRNRTARPSSNVQTWTNGTSSFFPDSRAMPR